MVKVTTDKDNFMNACLDTPLDALCVKKRGKKLEELVSDRQGHGKLVDPHVPRYLFRGCASQDQANEVLQQAIGEVFLTDKATVTVRGHGWGTGWEDDFVWTGTVKEFNRTWEID